MARHGPPPTQEPPPFGAQMRARREALNYTQEDLGGLLGCTRSTIAMVERGSMLTFKDPAMYAKLAEHLGDTADQWKELAERSRLSYLLPGTGEGVTDAHRRTADLLARYWPTLSPAAVRAIQQVVQHEVGRLSQPAELLRAA